MRAAHKYTHILTHLNAYLGFLMIIFRNLDHLFHFTKLDFNNNNNKCLNKYKRIYVSIFFFLFRVIPLYLLYFIIIIIIII